MRTLPFFLALATGCTPGVLNVVAREACPDQDITDPDDRCEIGHVEVTPESSVRWAFEVYASGPFAGTYAVTPEFSFDREVGPVTVDPQELVLGDGSALVELAIDFPALICGTGRAGVLVTEIEDDDDGPRDALASLRVDIVRDGAPVECP